MNLRTNARRIGHGTKHMPIPDLVMRIAAVLFGLYITLTTSDPWLWVPAGVITFVAAVSALWELSDAAIECEESNDDGGEDHPDENGDEFGTAA